jgi:hypothetical protein
LSGQLNPLLQIFDNLAGWVNNGSRGMMDKTVKGLASKYRQQIFQGKNADGSDMVRLTPATLKGPVRREGNPRIRESYGNSPLDATGETINSIQAVKVGSDEWEIAPQTDHGRAVLQSNAKTSHGGFRFYGDTPKPVRDPLQVEDAQLDFVEEAIYKDLDRLVSGL